tara:strand:- start:94 stop:813 length:720 start_codon:yes stop_codon:yes gene_type:complete
MYKLFLTSTLILSIAFSGTLTGTVNFEGKTKKRKPIPMDSDPVCGSSHKDSKALSESFVVDKDKNLKNVLVWLDNVKYSGDVTKTPAVIDQVGCVYTPHVQGVMKGQEVLIKNSDATLHNIHSMAKVNNQFNFAMPKVVKEKKTSFDKLEDPFYIKCDVHPWMKTWISVFNHPYFATTDDNGNYTIENIPAGEYNVIAWHEMDAKFEGFKQSGTVTVSADGKSELSFTMKKGPKHKKKK